MKYDIYVSVTQNGIIKVEASSNEEAKRKALELMDKHNGLQKENEIYDFSFTVCDCTESSDET